MTDEEKERLETVEKIMLLVGEKDEPGLCYRGCGYTRIASTNDEALNILEAHDKKILAEAKMQGALEVLKKIYIEGAWKSVVLEYARHGGELNDEDKKTYE